MSWGEWFDLKVKDVLADFYIVGIIITILIIGWFLIQIINIIKK